MSKIRLSSELKSKIATFLGLTYLPENLETIDDSMGTYVADLLSFYSVTQSQTIGLTSILNDIKAEVPNIEFTIQETETEPNPETETEPNPETETEPNPETETEPKTKTRSK